MPKKVNRIYTSFPESGDEDFWGKDADINKIEERQAFLPNPGHEWRQRGPYLICNSCSLQHAVYIGINKHLMGFDKNGKAILHRFKS